MQDVDEVLLEAGYALSAAVRLLIQADGNIRERLRQAYAEMADLPELVQQIQPKNVFEETCAMTCARSSRRWRFSTRSVTWNAVLRPAMCG